MRRRAFASACHATWLLLLLLPLAARAGEAQDLAPVLDHQPIRTAVAGEPLTVRARIVSASGKPIAEPTVLVRLPGVTSFSRMAMKADAAFKDIYLAELPGQHVLADFDYFLEAFDEDGNGPGRSGTAEAPHHVTVVAKPAPQPAPQPPPTVAPAASTTPVGRLDIVTLPLGAQITVDGLPLGPSPRAEQARAGVVHRVRAEAPGYLAAEVETSVVEGQAVRVELRLEEEPSRMLINASGVFLLPGMYNQVAKLSFTSGGFGGDSVHLAVTEGFGADLSLTYVFARHHGLGLSFEYETVKFKSDVQSLGDSVVAKANTWATFLAYRGYFGPFAVFRPWLGLLVGGRMLSLGEGSQVSWGSGSERSKFYPAVCPEIGLAFELPAHITLQASIRIEVLSMIMDGPLLWPLGAGIGVHFL